MEYMKEKILYQTPQIVTVNFFDAVDIITSSGGASGGGNGGGNVVPPITNGGDYSGGDY